jgi:hypothetical protein
MRTNCSITVYNKFIIAGAETYQRTQVLDVEWENRKAANILKSGLLATDQATVFIPFARAANYLAPKAWLAAKTGKWTLQIGDCIVKGLVMDEIHAAVFSPPSAAFTMSDLKAKYDDVLQIKSVDTKDMGSVSMRHFQIGAS